MKLFVTTPSEVVAEVDEVAHVRAEDETGAFGILPGHADFVTVLPISVLTWRGPGGEGFVLVRGGVLTVREGALIEVAARGAWRQADLSRLDDAALAELRRSEGLEEVARTGEARLHLATMRQIERVLRAGRDDKTSAPPMLNPDREGAAS